MCKILIFGGTTEGRQLCEECVRNNIPAFVSVTTEYGAGLLDKNSCVTILTGRKNAAEMSDFITKSAIELVIDATHPYASEATANIKKACAECDVEYVRVKRESEHDDYGIYFENVSSAADYLNKTPGRILFTTGSKELSTFSSITDFSQRCAVRVLPVDGIVSQCTQLGIKPENIIAQKGPFTKEQNIAHIKKYGADFLVTKESGRNGGFEEKAAAAKECGTKLVVIIRKDENGISVSQGVKLLLERKMHKKIYIVGTGMDCALTLTREGEEAIQNSDLLIGAERMLKPFESLKKPCLCEYKSEIIADYIRKSEYEKFAVLMSGDCGFYSGAQKLLLLLNDMETEVICGISSPVYFCSKIKIPWQDMHFSSLHGRNANAARLVSRYEKNFFLLGGDVTVSQLCQKLCDYGLENVTVCIGENLSTEKERIFSGNAKDFTSLQTEKLCVAVVINPQYEKNIRTGIDDSEFIRDKVPMTKSEVRCAVISKLEIGRDDVCWDIGCGSGSVSVEMAMQCENGTVYAVDKNETAVRLTEQNSRRFACDNIKVIESDASDADETLPAPDCVFVGGSGGKLEKIINSAYNKNNSVKLVVTAVSLETLTDCMTIFEKLGLTAEITQISVTRTKKIGNHTMLSAENPVYIIKRNTK